MIIYLDHAERLFIYNKLRANFFKKELKNEKYLKKLWIDENTMILSIHPDMDMKYNNSLGHILMQDLIGEIGK